MSYDQSRYDGSQLGRSRDRALMKVRLLTAAGGLGAVAATGGLALWLANPANAHPGTTGTTSTTSTGSKTSPGTTSSGTSKSPGTPKPSGTSKSSSSPGSLSTSAAPAPSTSASSQPDVTSGGS